MITYPKTLRTILADPRVSHAEKDEDGCWVYLKDGWLWEGSHTIHEDTWRECLAFLKATTPEGLDSNQPLR